MKTWKKICRTTEVSGEIKDFSVAGKALAVVGAGGEYFVFDNLCTHADCELSQGMLDDQTVICLCHGSKFDLRTGGVKGGPATEPLATYKTKIEGEDLLVEV